MDSEHADRFVRAIQSASSRRGVLAGLLGFSALRPPGATHGKNRNSKSRRRRHKRKQRRKNKAQLWPYLDVALFIHNQHPTPVSVREWIWDDGREIGIGVWKAQGWKVIPAKPATGPEPFLDFNKNEDEVVVELSTGHVIDATNPSLGYPHITIWLGKWSGDGLDKGSTWQTLIDTGLDVNERRTTAGFQVQRLTDTSSHKRFQVNLA